MSFPRTPTRAPPRQARRAAPLKAIDYTIGSARGLLAAHEGAASCTTIQAKNIFIAHDGRVEILGFSLAQPETAPASTGTRLYSTERAIVSTPATLRPSRLSVRPPHHQACSRFGIVLPRC
jgi:hypothetical protein